MKIHDVHRECCTQVCQTKHCDSYGLIDSLHILLEFQLYESILHSFVVRKDETDDKMFKQSQLLNSVDKNPLRFLKKSLMVPHLFSQDPSTSCLKKIHAQHCQPKR